MEELMEGQNLYWKSAASLEGPVVEASLVWDDDNVISGSVTEKEAGEDIIILLTFSMQVIPADNTDNLRDLILIFERYTTDLILQP